MATAAPNQTLPLFYNELRALNLGEHRNFRIRRVERAPHIVETHALPATVDEFALLQRHYPIVFSIGDNPIPLALMGLSEGANVFFNEEGVLHDSKVYLPAYLRRYPFLLARLRPDADELSLCFDPTAGVIGEFDDGEPLFDGDQPSQATKNILGFCEQFETAGQRTTAFIDELKKSGLLMDGEVSIQPDGAPQPFIYRGFQMVDEEKLRALPAEELQRMNQNGMLSLIYAHLMSLSMIRDLFTQQVAQGKGPVAAQQLAPAEA